MVLFVRRVPPSFSPCSGIRVGLGYEASPGKDHRAGKWGWGTYSPRSLPAGLLLEVATSPTTRPSPTALALPETTPSMHL